jgi:hypothetical protein
MQVGRAAWHLAGWQVQTALDAWMPAGELTQPAAFQAHYGYGPTIA